MAVTASILLLVDFDHRRRRLENPPGRGQIVGGVACEPAAMPTIPSPTSIGVLGIVRTTRQCLSPPRCFSMNAELMPAMMEITRRVGFSHLADVRQGRGGLLRLDAQEQDFAIAGRLRALSSTAGTPSSLLKQLAPCRGNIGGDDLFGLQQAGAENAADDRLGHVPRANDSQLVSHQQSITENGEGGIMKLKPDSKGSRREETRACRPALVQIERHREKNSK